MKPYHPLPYPTTLQSPRLITRLLTNEDALQWQRFFDDEESMEFFPNPDNLNSEGRAKFWIDRQLQRYRENRFGLQAIILKKTNEFIGQCGLLSQELDGVMELEVGYHIFKEFRGNGYAPEAAKLFIDFAFENKLAESVVSIIHVKNVKSQRVAEKNGLQCEKTTTWLGKEVFVYRIR